MTHQISISLAHDLIARFLANKPDILKGVYEFNDPFANAETFELASINTMLAQTGTAALRVYFGMYGDEEGTPTDSINKIVLVLCSADIDGNDLDLAPTDEDSRAIVIDEGTRTPPFYIAPSLINNL